MWHVLKIWHKRINLIFVEFPNSVKTLVCMLSYSRYVSVITALILRGVWWYHDIFLVLSMVVKMCQRGSLFEFLHPMNCYQFSVVLCEKHSYFVIISMMLLINLMLQAQFSSEMLKVPSLWPLFIFIFIFLILIVYLAIDHQKLRYWKSDFTSLINKWFFIKSVAVTLSVHCIDNLPEAAISMNLSFTEYFHKCHSWQRAQQLFQ